MLSKLRRASALEAVSSPDCRAFQTWTSVFRTSPSPGGRRTRWHYMAWLEISGRTAAGGLPTKPAILAGSIPEGGLMSDPSAYPYATYLNVHYAPLETIDVQDLVNRCKDQW